MNLVRGFWVMKWKVVFMLKGGDEGKHIRWGQGQYGWYNKEFLWHVQKFTQFSSQNNIWKSCSSNAFHLWTQLMSDLWKNREITNECNVFKEERKVYNTHKWRKVQSLLGVSIYNETKESRVIKILNQINRTRKVHMLMG